MYLKGDVILILINHISQISFHTTVLYYSAITHTWHIITLALERYLARLLARGPFAPLRGVQEVLKLWNSPSEGSTLKRKENAVSSDEPINAIIAQNRLPSYENTFATCIDWAIHTGDTHWPTHWRQLGEQKNKQQTANSTSTCSFPAQTCDGCLASNPPVLEQIRVQRRRKGADSPRDHVGDRLKPWISSTRSRKSARAPTASSTRHATSKQMISSPSRKFPSSRKCCPFHTFLVFN